MPAIFINFVVIFLSLSISSLCAKEIKLGMSTALSGPTKNLGLQLRQGAQLYFSHYNYTLEGKKNPISLVSYDDGYEPHQTVLNTQKLLNEDKVFALFGYVGTPTSKAIMPILLKEKTIYFSPFTGAEFLRSPVKKNIFNIRASYYKEAETQVKYFVKQQKLTNVALFIQADDFGLAGSKGYTIALSDQNITHLQQVRYKRNTEDIKIATQQLKKLNPEVIFCVGTYSPIAKLINNLRAENIHSKIVMLSFAGAMSLQEELENFDDVYITSVMPNPYTSELKIVKQYRQEMAGNKLSSESLEGYINAATFVQIISKIPTEITQESFIKSAEKLNIDLEGLTVRFSTDNHQALHTTYLNRVTKNGLIEVSVN